MPLQAHQIGLRLFDWFVTLVAFTFCVYHYIDYNLEIIYSVKANDFILALVAICLIKASYFTVDILTVIGLYHYRTLLTLDI